MSSALEFLQEAIVARLRTRQFHAQARGGRIEVIPQGISDLEQTIEEKVMKRSGIFTLAHYPLPSQVIADTQSLSVNVKLQLSIYEQVKSNKSGLGCLGLAEKDLGTLHGWELPQHRAWSTGRVMFAREHDPMEILPSLPGFNKIALHLTVSDVGLYSENPE
jgi:hypothetical protein